jgi:hypothetical protein
MNLLYNQKPPMYIKKWGHTSFFYTVIQQLKIFFYAKAQMLYLYSYFNYTGDGGNRYGELLMLKYFR